MKISYALTCCTELEELKKLIPFLLKHKREQDEIVVQQDGEEEKVFFYLENLHNQGKIKHFCGSLKNNFANFKNNLFEHCVGDFLIFLDADEMPHEFLIKNLPYVLENSDIDLLYISRINTVKGITKEHIKKWGWKVDENKWINYPDRQSRIVRNIPELRWEGHVHETIKGYKTFSNLPKIEEWSLYHHKTIEKQEFQNKYYDTL